ncbi:MFS transporter [Campylobacter coli]|nr:MFS transporter [Campylobacter coli]
MLKILIIFCAILTLAIVYAPQPITPLLSDYFHVNLHQISWIISVTLIPLAIAPLLYGYLLEIFSLKKILIVSLFLCSVFSIIGNLNDNFYFFLFFRLLQAICIPAILTALLTLLSRLESDNIQKNIAIYVGATTFGGFVGRVFGSFLSDLFSWHFALNFFSILMLFCSFLFLFFKERCTSLNTQTSLKDFLPFVKEFRFVVILFCVFVIFFSFQSIVSFLPFHLKESIKDITQTQIGLVYLGFLTGVISSLLIGKTIEILGSKIRTAIFGFLVFITGCFCMMIGNFYFAFFAMFVFCSGMFISHCIFSGILNSNTDKKGLANGIYLTFYYSGGALGSVLPSFYYESFGWEFLCIFTAFLLFIALIIFSKFRYFYK